MLWMDVGVVEYDSSSRLYTVLPLDGDPDEFEVSRYVTIDSVTIVASTRKILNEDNLLYSLEEVPSVKIQKKNIS